MSKQAKPGRPTEKPVQAAQVGIWIEADLMQFVDEYAKSHDRSRAWVINNGLRRWRKTIENGRRSSATEQADRERAAKKQLEARAKVKRKEAREREQARRAKQDDQA